MNVRPVDISGNTVISTFAGCGGSSLGYHMAGYKELLAIEWDKNAVETFKLNFPDVPVWQRDIKTVTAEEIFKFTGLKKGELFLFDGSPPCQGFSTAGKRVLNDPRNDLFKEYCRLLIGLQPKVFVMENVSGMIKGKMKGKFIEILQSLKDCGYNVKCKLMNAMWYDVPQSRERLIFIGTRNDLGIEPTFPKPNNYFISVKKALYKVKSATLPPNYQKYQELFKEIKQGRSLIQSVPNEVLIKYSPRMVNNKRFNYTNICKRLNENKICPTITKTFINLSEPPIHYAENRHLSIEEVKRLASFPDNYFFMGKFQEQWARIGNSVPPNLMKAIALNILTIFENVSP